MISAGNFHQGCNSHIYSWQILISGEGVCSLLERSIKYSSAYDATQPLTLAVTKQDLGDFCKTFIIEKDIEFSSTFFFPCNTYEQLEILRPHPSTWELPAKLIPSAPPEVVGCEAQFRTQECVVTSGPSQAQGSQPVPLNYLKGSNSRQA